MVIQVKLIYLRFNFSEINTTNPYICLLINSEIKIIDRDKIKNIFST